jgi:hypothetical protein
MGTSSTHKSLAGDSTAPDPTRANFSDVRGVLDRRLQTANTARFLAPITFPAPQELSPFKQGSPLAPVPNGRKRTSREQQQQQHEAAQAEMARHQPALGIEPSATMKPRDAIWYHAPDQETPAGALPEEAPAGITSSLFYDTAAIVLKGTPSAHPNRPEMDEEATQRPLGIAEQIGGEPEFEDQQTDIGTMGCTSCRQRNVRCEWGLPENSKLTPCLRCTREGEECSFSGLSVVEESDSEDIAQVVPRPTDSSLAYTTLDEPEPFQTLTDIAVHCRVDSCTKISQSSRSDEYVSLSPMNLEEKLTLSSLHFLTVHARRYPCQFEGCTTRPFGSHGDLKRHVASVHAPKDRPCPVVFCERVFSRKDHLRRHIRRTHPEWNVAGAHSTGE